MSSKLNFFIYKIFSTWFYLGTFKYFPGTIGSIASLPFAALIVNYGGNYLLIFFTIIFFFIGVKISDKYSKLINKKDPSEIVIDEVVGQWLVLIFVPLDIKLYILALVIFRFFDIISYFLRLSIKIGGEVVYYSPIATLRNVVKPISRNSCDSKSFYV